MIRQALLIIAILVGGTTLAGCALEVVSSDTNADEVDIDVVSAALTWQGEMIERNDSGSSQTAYYMYTVDVAPPSSVCGPDGDYIIHYNRAGAYANRSKLRMDGETSAARCFLNLNPSGLSARVYDDNHVWVCAGYWRVTSCGGPGAVFGGLQLWQAP